jgi:hypothetical protein
MDFSFRFKISTENFKLISSIWVRTKPHCRRIEGDRTILFSRTFFPVFFLVLFFTVLFSPVLFIPVRFTLTFFFVLFGSIFFPVFLFSCTFFPYFLLPYFFPPYYFFHVLFTRNFSKVATFEIQRFKISVSFFSSTYHYITVHVPCGIAIQTSPVGLPLDGRGARMRELKGPKMNVFNLKED